MAYTEEASFALLEYGSQGWHTECNHVFDVVDKVAGIWKVVAGEAMDAETVVYLSAADDRIYKASAADITKMPAIGILLDDAELGAECEVRYFGWHDDLNVSPSIGSAGQVLFVSDTPGELTAVRPVNAQVFGYVKAGNGGDGARILINPIPRINQDLQYVSIVFDDLAAGIDLADIPILYPTSPVELVSIKVLSMGTPNHPVSPSSDSVFTIKDSGGNTIVTKTYSTGSPFPTKSVGDLGVLSGTHKLLNIGETVSLFVDNQLGADLPKFALQLIFFHR